MRHVVFAVLVAVPTALITWMVTIGTAPQPDLCPACGMAPSAGGHSGPGAGVGAEAHAPAANPDPPADPFLALLSPPLAGATPTTEPETFRSKGLFAYINGGAPAYIERNFKRLLACELKTQSGGELTCDIYDMGTPEDAVSIYTFEAISTAETIAIGDAGRKSDMALAFRKGAYYVKLTAFDKAAEAELPALAAALATRL